jgi:hypothetical protein
MSNLLDRLGTDEIIPIAIFTIIFGTVLIVALSVIISWCVYKIRRDSIAAQLKQDMLDRGMSAEEIKTVLEARPKS